LEEKSASEASKKMLKKTGIGLILFRLEKGRPSRIRTDFGSRNHKGEFAERTRESMTGGISVPECFVFPSAEPEWLSKFWKINFQPSEVFEWGYNAKVLPASGSMIIFSSGGAFIGQGIAIGSRNTTRDERKKGSKERFLLLWGKSILKYPREVPIAEVKDSIDLVRNRSLRGANLAIKYRAISLSEGQKVVAKALDVLKIA
jgi:hypothetical protein